MTTPPTTTPSPVFDARRWWYESEHKEGEIARVVAFHPEAAVFVGSPRVFAVPPAPPSFAIQSAHASDDRHPLPRVTHDIGAPSVSLEHRPDGDELCTTTTAAQDPTAAAETNGRPNLPPLAQVHGGGTPSARSQRRAARRANGTARPRTFLVASGDDLTVQENTLGEMTERCTACGALMWVEERKPRSSKRNPVFELCCKNGGVRLPLFPNPPMQLMDLLQGTSPRAIHFRDNIRAYNSAFGFTSSGASFDRSLANNRTGVYTYRVQGAVYRLMSRGLLPEENEEPRFAQIYIFDTDYQIDRRNAIFPDLDRAVLMLIQDVLQESNPFVAQFMAHNETMVRSAATQTFALIVGEERQPNRQYERPTNSEVAVLMLGDEDDGNGLRSIIIRKRGGDLQFVSQLDPRYDPLHFVLLFVFGHHGWSVRLKQATGVTMNQFYCFHLMVREATQVLHPSGRLTQEYTVDAYAKIEESRLMWVRRNQQTLRANLYQGLLDQVGGDDAAPAGRMVILPPSFTGGPRYMTSLYQDAMAIVRKVGKPDLFITMTCNPTWKEITKALLPEQKAQDRFDLCCRVFRMKLKALLHLIIEKKVFGEMKGRVYVVEFQKRGLPHAHMLWILQDEYKLKTTEDIDRIVCAELPHPDDKELYDCVTKNMLHGPCGLAKPSAPCTVDGVCNKKFPKVYVAETQFASDGYPLYRRRDDGHVVVKGSHVLDNRWVVPYNPYLCRVFRCHINVEICSSVKSVKYL